MTKNLRGVFISLSPMSKFSSHSAEVWLDLIRNTMVEHANFIKAKGMQKYMKDHFSFYGVNSPMRKQLLKSLYVSEGKPDPNVIRSLALLLWNEEEREMQYIALDLLDTIKRKLEPVDLELIETLITSKSWWDTVDLLACHLAGEWLLKYPKNKAEILQRWFDSENMWLQRTVLIHQLNYKQQTDELLLYSYIEKMNESKEFFIRKAIGWALRQYARTKPESVKIFVQKTPLSPLSFREATKHM
jgi:3-methyladenine DNA glycosylase AlkD